jgi:hypothetical protein
MPRSMSSVPALLVSSFFVATMLTIPLVTAQEAPPPEAGPTVIEDSLTEMGAVRGGPCPSGRGGGEFVGEGYSIKVAGPCGETGAAFLTIYVPGLTVKDGEIRLEMKVVSGTDRAYPFISFRQQGTSALGYYVSLSPSRATVELYVVREDSRTVLMRRDDLVELAAPDSWHSLAVRLQGSSLWVLLNDQPVLSAVDATFDQGDLGLALQRTGNASDEQESAVVYRNLRVSLLAEGDPARASAYTRP